MATKIQVRRDTSANWTSLNPTLSSGEIGYETNTGKFKIGNGSTLWSALAYFLDSSDLSGYLTASSASTTYQAKVANVSDAEIGHLDGVTSSIQTQLNTKLSESSASNTYLTQTSASSTYATQTNLTNYANIANTPISGFRNLLINGDMRINQRGVTSTTADNTFCFDRWKMNNSGGTCTYTAQTFTLGNAISDYEPTNYARIVTSGQSTSSHFAILRQNIEDVRTFAGQTFTVSFWAKADSGTPKVALEIEQNFGSGGSPSSAVTTYAGQVTLSTSWARYSLTVTMPSISGKTIGTTANTSHVLCSLFVSAGSDWNARTGTLGIQSNTFDFWGIQAEKGSIATPFEQRPITTELALCQRYYYRRTADSVPYTWTYGFATSTSSADFLFTHPVTMRTSPTPEIQGTMSNYALDQGGGINPTALASLRNNTYISELYATIASSTLVSFRPYRLYAPGVTGGYIGFIAEF